MTVSKTMHGDDQSFFNYQPMSGSERPPHPHTKHLGAANLNDEVTVTFVVLRRPDGPPLKSIKYFHKTPIAERERITSQEFEERHGATQSDLNDVARYCRIHQLTVLDANRSRRTLIARGTVDQMNATFGIHLQQYESKHGRYHGYEGQTQLPTVLIGVVEAVLGLDNRPVPIRHANAGDPQTTVPLTPQQVAQRYNFPAGTGAGQTIGIFAAQGFGFAQHDIELTMNGWGISTPPTPSDFPAGSNNNQSDAETILDITVASAIANNANIVVFFTAGYASMDYINALGSMIHPTGSDPAPTIISMSYTLDADDDNLVLSATDYLQLDNLFADAANKQITVLVSSGDYGVAAASFGENVTQAEVWFPASDPWVLACGGTTIGVNGSNPAEYVWNDDSGVTGGGISAQFPAPFYQNAFNLPNSLSTGMPGRGIPDVAGNASANSGYNLFVGGSDTPPNGGPTGGTSAVAPLYAGLVALINENLGQSVGFLNPTLYALSATVCHDITAAQGPTNNSYSNSNALSGPIGSLTGYTAGVGWDACTGLGTIDGTALLTALQDAFQKTIGIIMQRDTFSEDEVTAASGGAFQQAIFVTVSGLQPSDFPNGGITTLSPDPTTLGKWAPSISNPSGASGATNITITPTAISSDQPSLPATVQLFTFTYTVTFPDKSAFSLPSANYPDVLSLTATLNANTGTMNASGEIELILAADPFFSSESNGGSYYLSEDIRVFYAEEGSTMFGAPALGGTPDEALNFINWIISHLSGPLGTAPDGHTFEDLPTDEYASALSLLPTTLAASGNRIYNFAIARVRLDGTATAQPPKTLRAFFRIFSSQSVAMAYEAPTSNMGVSSATGAYRQWSDGTQNGQKIPLLGISSDGTEYISIPCFASARVANVSAGTNMTTQLDGPNVRTAVMPPAGSTEYLYFGCWLDNNQSDMTFQTNMMFPLQPGINPDGPFNQPTLYTISQVLNRGGHQCLVVEIADDDAPILNGATPGSSDKLAQRNLAFTTVANPGITDSRLAIHTFEIKPSHIDIKNISRADELMIDWGNVPIGCVASIYLPAVAATEILGLAAKMYVTHDLVAADAHTIQCKAGGITYIPIPAGKGANYAGLFSMQLPFGVIAGQQFTIVVRQISSTAVSARPVIGASETGSQGRVFRAQRRIYGAFQINIPVSTKSKMLIPEERNLSLMKWIGQTIPLSSRWYPVFLRYLDQLIGRVNGLGGNGESVPPTPTGIWPGLSGEKPSTGPHEHHYCTGKVEGIIYDHFGDFEAFILETCTGEKHRYVSHELSVHKLVQRAWSYRILTTVTSPDDHPERLLEIMLHGEPPCGECCEMD